MRCQIPVFPFGELSQCSNEAQIKHHIKYFPEETIAVCGLHHDMIHSGKYPDLERFYIKYKPGDSKQFYSQNDRIADFIDYLKHRRRH